MNKVKRSQYQYYEVRQIDALSDGEGWVWNTSYHIGTFHAISGREVFGLRRFLVREGIRLAKWQTIYQYDGDIFEIVTKGTKEPLFAAIPCDAPPKKVPFRPYDRYKDEKPVATMHLTNMCGIALFEPKYGEDCDFISAFHDGEKYSCFTKSVVVYDNGKPHIRKCGSRYYFDNFIRTNI